jgi:hypothetical protein
MTFRQWLWHFRFWLRMFPLPRHDGHTWISLVNCNRYFCHCGAAFVDAEEEAYCAECAAGTGGEDNTDEPCEWRQAEYKGGNNETGL